MRRDRLHVEGQVVRYYPVADSPLQAETRRTEPAPLPSQRLVEEALDEAHTRWPRQARHILPFLVPFQDVPRSLGQLPVDSAVFQDLPHAIGVDMSFMVCQVGSDPVSTRRGLIRKLSHGLRLEAQVLERPRLVEPCGRALRRRAIPAAVHQKQRFARVGQRDEQRVIPPPRRRRCPSLPCTARSSRPACRPRRSPPRRRTPPVARATRAPSASRYTSSCRRRSISCTHVPPHRMWYATFST